MKLAKIPRCGTKSGCMSKAGFEPALFRNTTLTCRLNHSATLTAGEVEELRDNILCQKVFILFPFKSLHSMPYSHVMYTNLGYLAQQKG